MVDPITYLLLTVLKLYLYVVVIWGIMSMLISFGVLNPYQPVVAKIFRALEQLVEPALRPIRRILPPMGSLDLSPLVLILGIQFLQYCILYFSRMMVVSA